MCSSMEGTESYPKHKKLVTSEQKHLNPSKFYHHFLFKATLVVAFMFILPIFPKQSPEFVNQNLITRSWELFHLLLVGIAISYGLFSRPNEDTEKDNSNFKLDNAPSYVSRLLQVSSVFYDEAESPTGSESFDENKVQTWSSHYYRNEPMVVVANENYVLKQESANTSRIGERPLIFPIRSLKSRVSDPDSTGSDNESSLISSSNSKPRSRRFSRTSSKTINGEYGGIDHEELEQKLKESVVLPSPIPWRSRSGRMGMKEDIDSPPHYSLPPSMEESRVSKTQVSRSSRSNSASSSPKLSPSPRNLSPSASSSTESQTKVLYKPSPPPAPPPPPKMVYKSSSLKLSSTYNQTSLQKEFRRSSTSEPKDMSRNRGESCLDRVNYGPDLNPINQFDSSPVEKSVRTIRASDVVSDREMENKGWKKVGYDRTSFSAERMSRILIPRTRKQSFEEFKEDEEEGEDSIDKILMESDDDTYQSEDDDIVGESPKQSVKNEEATPNSVSDGPPDVDKKADEFIAKFREQIRLQRIKYIKRSSGDMSRNLSRGMYVCRTLSYKGAEFEVVEVPLEAKMLNFTRWFVSQMKPILIFIYLL